MESLESPPPSASIVVVGAGIVGASLAYRLARRGWRDVLVVDQGPIPLTGGSTTHAPGGVFATNYSRQMTRLALETVDMMSSLDDPAHVVLGKEPVRAVGDDAVVGYVRSAAYGYSVGACLASAMLPVELATPGTAVTLGWFGERLPATVVKDPVWDPAGVRIRA